MNLVMKNKNDETNCVIVYVDQALFLCTPFLSKRQIFAFVNCVNFVTAIFVNNASCAVII